MTNVRVRMLALWALALAATLLGSACQEPDHSCAALGIEGCPCGAKDTCQTQPEGSPPLVCQAGLCVATPGCTPGSEDCACATGARCAAGLTCSGATDGEPGTCVAKCPRGSEGCACFTDESCGDAKDGTALLCGLGKCVRADCTPGSAGCVCAASDTCDAGYVCAAGFCAVDTGQTLAPPKNPVCYTPCKGGSLVRVIDGKEQTFTCSSEGLIEGCLGGATCVNGSCVAPKAKNKSRELTTLAADVPGCTSDAECPDFQSCIQGACYSDCEVDSDCRGERKCHRKACRLPCNASPGAKVTCASDSYCESEDGASGFCMPLAAPSGALAEVTTGSIRMEPGLVEFTSSRVSGSFEIVNDSPAYQEVTVRRKYHREYGDGRAQQIDENALSWLRIAEKGKTPSADAEIKVGVDGGGGRTTVQITSADNPTLDRWDGLLEITHRTLGVVEVPLTYRRLPEGQWSGEMFYLANFGTSGLDAWRADRDDNTAVRAVGNALIQRWHAVRQGRISMREFKAVLTATRDETWKVATIKQRCPAQGAADPNVGCYPYDNAEGLAVYSSFLPDAPIPSGATGFPLAINLAPDATNGRAWHGRIVSDVALQYAGNPAVTLRFANDPAQCTRSFADTCLNLIEGFGADVIVGGRYPTTSDDTNCVGAQGFQQVAVPWLVPGFTKGTSVDAATNGVFRYECRDTLNPLGSATDVRELNKSYAASNPVPNGHSLARRLRMLDGALINQSEIFILFEEQFPSPLDPADANGFNAYGYILLKRTPADLDDAAYTGSVAADNRAEAAPRVASCDGSILSKVLGSPTASITAANVDALAQVVVNGAPVDAVTVPPLSAIDTESVHYFCEDTGYFDGGKDYTGVVGSTSVACPGGSRVVYFTITDDPSTTAIEGSAEWMRSLSCQSASGICRAGQPCSFPVGCESYAGTSGEDRDTSACAGAAPGCTVGQSCARKGDCGTQLEQWRAQARALGVTDGNYPTPAPGASVTDAQRLSYREDPVWRCTDPSLAQCDTNRDDLRDGKEFFPRVPAAAPTYRGLIAEVDQAFRYKTKFKGREGTSIGFTPDVCVPGSDVVPYCYDPVGIQAIEQRVDCAAHLYTDHYARLSVESRSLLKSYLTRNFAYVSQRDPNRATPRIFDGFEHLNAELLVMLGDEALTNASASRFDLAGQRVAPFPGDQLEPGGIRLSGGAGFEMFSLYLATQYYQLALDRFFGLGPLIWRSIGTGANALPPGEGFISQATATSWFQRLIGASAHKARAFSEIARRYESFNRPDLARLVTQRAYTAAYMEAALLSRIMFRLTSTADAVDVAQIVSQVELAQRTYASALRDMQQVYAGISDEATVFGYPPDYVPFPALARDADTNAFEEVLAQLEQRVADAADKEQKALSDRRDFETDAAEFQSELSALRIDYDKQLSDICGSFQAKDPADPTKVQIVPAIPENASLDERLLPFGDPCGHVGNGQLYQAMLDADQRTQELATLRLEQRHLMQKILDTEARAKEQCDGDVEYAKWTLEQENAKIALSTVIEAVNLGVDAIERFAETTETALGTLKCSPLDGECAVAAPIATTQAGLSTAWNLAVLGLKATVSGLTLGKEAIESAQVVEGILQDCDTAKLDAKYEIKQLFLDAEELSAKTLEQAIAIQSAVAGVEGLRNQATSLLGARAEALSHLIDVRAAKNDPNVRIYTQDSVFSAERTFRRALLEAYRATRVFEYYTNQSYAAKNDLFLVRMVQYGEPSLEAYVASLEDAYNQFEEQFGKPDLRVAVVSLRDDVLRIPRLDEDGTALTHEERIALLRKALVNPELLDDHGYVSAPFATALSLVSPLTFNHKVRFIEAEIVMQQNQGDDLGRIYLAQRGTSTVRDAAKELTFYSFPERTAVIDVFFNGDRKLSTDLGTGEQVYRSERLRDRPLINTGWNLSFNQKDEMVNEDIDLASIDDIRLYLYYTDFTEL